MSYATLMDYLDVDHVSKTLISVAAELAEKFSAKLIGLSALAIVPPVVAEGVVIADHASESEIAQLAEAGDDFRARAGPNREIEWRSALEIPTDTLMREARCADLIIIGQSGRSMELHRAVHSGTVIMEAGRPVLVAAQGESRRSDRNTVSGIRCRSDHQVR